MFSVIVIILGLLLVILLVNAALQPPDFQIVRAAVFIAPADQIFTNVNDLHLWKAWSPWARLDQECKYEFKGPEKGKGAAMKWKGNMKVGEGMMTITESRPVDYIQMELQFSKPFKATNIAEFAFVPIEGGTQVTWLMRGRNNFIGRIMNILMDCDKMVGGQFEQGFANLRKVVETRPMS